MVLLLIAAQLYAQVPSVASSNIVFSNTFCNRTNVSWDAGDGNGRIVVARKATPVTANPTDDTYYIPRDTFGKNASKISADEFVVYNGSGNSVIVYGLESNTVYHFKIFEYNGAGNVFSYRTSNAPSDSIKTEWLYSDFTVDEPHQCENVDTFRFYEAVTQSGSGAVSYSWTFGDGGTSTAADPVHSYSNYGIFTVKLTASTIGCVHTKTFKDTVAPLPIVNFILDPDSANNTAVQCFYNANGKQNRFAFESQVTNPYLGTVIDAAEYNWFFGDGSPVSIQAHARKKRYNQPGVYRVSLVVTTSKNNRVYCTDSNFMYVEVKPRPLDSTKIWFSDTSMCLNSNNFQFQNQTGIQGSSVWTFGDGNSAIGDSVSHVYGSAGKYEVVFEIVDTAGCYDRFDDSVEVVPQPNNFFNGLKAYYCQFEPRAILRPNLSGGQFEGDQVSAFDSSFNPTQLGVNTVRYIYQINNCIDTFSKQTIVMPNPEMDLGADTSICLGTTLRIGVQADSSAFLWNTNAVSDSIDVSTSGLYWVEKNNGWCIDKDSINIRVIEAPDISLGSDSTLCGGVVRTVDVTVDEGNYVWNDGYPDPKRVIDETGVYWVTVSNKCGEDSDTVDLIVLPYACEIYIPSAFSPNSDGLNETFKPIGQVEMTRMLIFNRWGEILYESDSPDAEWNGYFMDVKVQTGIYFYLITYLKPEGASQVATNVAGEIHVVY